MVLRASRIMLVHIFNILNDNYGKMLRIFCCSQAASDPEGGPFEDEDDSIIQMINKSLQVEDNEPNTTCKTRSAESTTPRNGVSPHLVLLRSDIGAQTRHINSSL